MARWLAACIYILLLLLLLLSLVRSDNNDNKWTATARVREERGAAVSSDFFR